MASGPLVPGTLPPASCRDACRIPRAGVAVGLSPRGYTRCKPHRAVPRPAVPPNCRRGGWPPPASWVFRASAPEPGDSPWLKRGLAHLTGSVPPLERGNYGIFSPGSPSGASPGACRPWPSPLGHRLPAGFRVGFCETFVVSDARFRSLPLVGLRPSGTPHSAPPAQCRRRPHPPYGFLPSLKGEIMAIFPRDSYRELPAAHAFSGPALQGTGFQPVFGSGFARLSSPLTLGFAPSPLVGLRPWGLLTPPARPSAAGGLTHLTGFSPL